MDNRDVAAAFSGHRFHDTYDRLAPGIQWVAHGQGVIEGRDAVVAACEESATHMAGLAGTSFERFLCVGEGDAVAVDAIGRYEATDGTVSRVTSADFYEFDDAGRIATITSYAVELPDTD